jgi:hypothetical protein
MATIWKYNKWIDSVTGLEVTNPMTSRYDQGLSTERTNALAGFESPSFKNYSNLANMSLNDQSKSQLKMNSPSGFTDRFTQNATSLGNPNYKDGKYAGVSLNQAGLQGQSNWWEKTARGLGYKDGSETPGKWDKLKGMFNEQNIKNFGTLAEAGGNIMNAWSALQTNKILRAEMENNNANSRANFAANAGNYNDQAEMRNQWLAAQGRDPLYNKQSTTY